MKNTTRQLIDIEDWYVDDEGEFDSSTDEFVEVNEYDKSDTDSASFIASDLIEQINRGVSSFVLVHEEEFLTLYIKTSSNTP